MNKFTLPCNFDRIVKEMKLQGFYLVNSEDEIKLVKFLLNNIMKSIDIDSCIVFKKFHSWPLFDSKIKTYRLAVPYVKIFNPINENNSFPYAEIEFDFNIKEYEIAQELYDAVNFNDQWKNK